MGGADLGDRARRPAAARARVRGHPLGRGADARPDRASGERDQGRPAADPLPRPRRPARRSGRRGEGATSAPRRSSWTRCRARTAPSSSTRSPQASRSSSRTSSAPPCSTRRRATRSSSRRRCGCCSRAAGADRHPAHRQGDDLRPDRPAAAGGAEACSAAPPSPDARSGRARSRRSARLRSRRARLRSSSTASFSSASHAPRSGARRRTGSSTS